MEEIIKRIGLDKLTHWGWGGWIAAMVVITLMLQDMQGVSWRTLLWPTVGLAVVAVLSVIKEMADTEANWRDVLWSIGGAASLYLAALIGVLLNKAQFGW